MRMQRGVDESGIESIAEAAQVEMVRLQWRDGETWQRNEKSQVVPMVAGGVFVVPIDDPLHE